MDDSKNIRGGKRIEMFIFLQNKTFVRKRV